MNEVMEMSSILEKQAEMRMLGSTLLAKGFFETDLIDGKFVWMNDFALAQLGMELSQIQNMTVFSLVPESLLDTLSGIISDRQKNRDPKYMIWPMNTIDGKIIWWYIWKVFSDDPFHWSKGELICKTEKSGSNYIQMCITMNIVNDYSDLHHKFHDHFVWSKDEIDRLNKENLRLRNELAETHSQHGLALSAMRSASDAAMAATSGVQNLRSEMHDALSDQTKEIMRLIRTDAVHDERIEAFEKHVKETASRAMTEITAQASMAGDTIKEKAAEAGKGLSKRVTVPVGIIATIMTIIQWLINNWHNFHF